MSAAANQPLPDIDALQAQLAAALAERDAAIIERDAALRQNDRLAHLLRQLQRMQFGRRSEKLDCRFRFQCETGGVRELKALREISPAAFSVSIETGSAFFRFQLGLIDHLIDRTMNPCRGASKTQMIPVGLRLSAALFSYAAC